MRRRKLGTKVLACVLASALTVSALPVTSMTANAASYDDASVNVMIDKGGYKTEVFGTGTYDWTSGIDRTSKLPPATVYLTDNYKETVGTVPTSDWASSVVFDQYSESLYAHPLAYRAASNGMQMATPAVVDTVSTIDGEPQVESLLEDSSVELVVGGSGFAAKDAKVDKTTDWTYDIFMENAAGTASMMTTMSKGSPYAYYEFDGVKPQISLGAGATNLAIYKNGTSSNQIGISVTNKTDNTTHYYGVYAPSGTTWTNANGTLTANLPSGKNYISIATLPNASDATFADYAKYAYNFITDTVVEWDYNEETSKVTTTYHFVTTNMETGATGGDTIMALYPHQYRYLSDGDLASYTYKTIRGTMKTIKGSSYETEMTYTGILPVMPTLEDGKGTLIDQISYYWDYYKNTAGTWATAAEWQYGGYDTYWMGKNFNRLADVIMMSSVLDDDNATIQGWTNDMVDGLQGQLEYWFDPYQVYANGAQIDNYFYYHEDYGTMIGYASGYGSDFEVNDHHFHYGYWIKAAATVAMMDKTDTWEDEYGGMVYELIDDIANVNRDGRSHNNIAGKSTTKYPFLRNFDIYEGHSWASGVANYEYDVNGNMIDPNGGLSGGNNQESSTEAVNAWAALVLWGEAVGDEEIRDLGVYLYTTEVAAIEDYYYDIHDEIFTDAYEDAAGYNIQTVTRLFAGRYDHTAWWTEDPIEVTTISMLPMTGATLFLAKDKDKVKEVYESISPSSKQWTDYVANVNQICANYGKSGMLTDPYTHQDILAEYYALYDPQAAMNMWSIGDIDGKQYIEFGDSRAHTYGYIQSMVEYGTPDLTITGSTPFSMVFDKNGVKTYVAYNASNDAETVYFSDGTYIEVEAGAFYTGAKMGDGENPNITDEEEDTEDNTGDDVDDDTENDTENDVEDDTENDVEDDTEDESQTTERSAAGCELQNGQLVLYVTDSANAGSIVAYYRVYDTEAEAKRATLSQLPGYVMTKTNGVFEYNAGDVDTTKYVAYAFNQAGRDVPTVVALSSLSSTGSGNDSDNDTGNDSEDDTTDDNNGNDNTTGGSGTTERGDAGCEWNNGKLTLYVTDSANAGSIVAYYRVYDTEAEAKRATLSQLPGYVMTKTDGVFEFEIGEVDSTKYVAYAFNQAGRDVPTVVAVSSLISSDNETTIERGDAGYEIVDGKLILYVTDSPNAGSVIAYYRIYNSKAEALKATLSQLPGYFMTKTNGVFEYNAGAVDKTKYLVYAFNQAGREVPVVVALSE